MADILEKLLHMSLVGGVVIITVLIVRFFLKNSPKKYSYFLWAIVLVRLLCPFTVESPLSTIPHSVAGEELLEDLGDSSGERTNVYYDHMPEYDAAVEAGREPIPNMGVSGGYYVVTGEDGLSPAPAAKPDLTSILAALWLCGVAVMLLWGVRGYLCLKKRLRGAVVCDKGVYLSDRVDTPFVLGFFFPKIYLPAGISSGEWSYIVAHERCHIRRGDHITRVLAFAALAVHWFNPLVWLAFILSGRDMELSCDEAVLRSMGAELRQAYSASLLRLATGRSPLSAMPLAFGEGDPKERIRNLAKWRKPTRAMIIAALIVCIAAVVCLLTDPLEREAQIRVNGRVYTYVGSEEMPIGQVWELGTLEGILHRSDEEPEEDFHGTNLDEKYAGQPLYAGIDGRIYLFDENGYFLPFELPKGGIVSGPIEVARGDFNRDGQKDFITVTEYTDCVEIVLADTQSAKILWKDTASLAEGQQKCFIAQKGEEGDSIIRYTFNEDGYCLYHRFYIGENGELDEEKARSPIDNLYEDRFTDPEAISYSLPENSPFLLSTYGGSAVIGPINSETELGLSGLLAEIEPGDISDDGHYYRNDFQPETLAEAMNALGEPADAVFSGEIADWSYSFSIGGETDGAKKLYLNCGLSENLVQIVLEIGDKQQAAVYKDKALYTLLRHSRDVESSIDPYISREVNAAAEALMQKGLEEYAGNPAQFVDAELTVLSPHSGYVRDDGSEVELYDFAYALIPSKPENLIIAGGAVMDGDLRVHGTGVSYMAVEYHGGRVVKYAPLWGGYFFPEGGLDAEDIEIIENALSSGIEVTLQDPIIDDGSSYPLAIPYGVSVVTDLDGDGVTETVCQKVNEGGYRIESITVNGVEYLDKVLELCLPYPNNAEARSLPCWYLTDILGSDGKKEMTFYDGGPSADPVTFFFDYDKGELKYLGNIPYYSDSIKYSGDGYLTSWARLDVFQVWFAEHTWSIFGPDGTVQNEPRDFYYVDFTFRDYVIGDEYFPGSDTSPLLRDVKVYAEMDINSELRLYATGMEISILGTDNKEWLLISDGSREYYLHIDGASIEVPGGNYIEAQKVLNGLHYYG